MAAAMRKILVCQHVPFEILGTLNPLFKRVGFRIRYVNFGRYPHARPALDGYRGLVILGGPMSVDEVDAHPHLETEIGLVRDAIARQMPVLGICLGAQLIAHALGAEVRRGLTKEIGWYEVLPTEEGRRDPLFAHFDSVERIFQWHGDTFDIPVGAVRLAQSPGCENQAFRYGGNVYGLQFHLEVDEPLIERWLRVEAHRRELESLKGKIGPDDIRRETVLHIDRARALSDRVFSEFIRLFRLPAKRRALPSR
jgi:GMP synthase (glutamine-hydrolysing)